MLSALRFLDRFNTKYRKPQMCKLLAKNVRTCRAFSYHKSRCGNGILDDGEQCDSNDTYCKACKLSCPAGFYATRRGTCAKVAPPAPGPGEDEGAGGGALKTVAIVAGASIAAAVGYKFFVGRRKKGKGGRMPRTQQTADAWGEDGDSKTAWLLNPLYRGAEYIGLSRRKSNMD